MNIENVRFITLSNLCGKAGLSEIERGKVLDIVSDSSQITFGDAERTLINLKRFKNTFMDCIDVYEKEGGCGYKDIEKLLMNVVLTLPEDISIDLEN